MKAELLVAEDDRRIRDGLAATLESDGYSVTCVADGDQALAAWKTSNYDLVILDIMMPKRDGYEVCREIRKSDAKMPILFLSAKSEEIDKVVGLKLGADDYLTKPFGIHELLARVEAILRRCRTLEKGPQRPQHPFQFGELQVQPLSLTALRDGRVIPISERELRMMAAFRQCAGQVLSRRALLDTCWGIDYVGTTRTLDQHIAQLRKKVEFLASDPQIILTIHGVGYRYSGKGGEWSE